MTRLKPKKRRNRFDLSDCGKTECWSRHREGSGATSRKDGYLEGNNYIVSWCVGHLVGLADASSYDERFAKWRYSDLPIVPEEWLFEIPKDKQKQFKVLRDLMRDKRVTELSAPPMRGARAS